MTEANFWELIRDTRNLQCRAHVAQLVDKLCTLPINEILHFGWWWHKKKIEAHRWDLWGAAYIINGGCSDDGFEYFCDWLILQGQTVFDAALDKPDRLAEVLSGGPVEHQCNPALFAYQKLSGKNDYYEARNVLGLDWPKQPELGEGWDFDNAKLMRKRYPRLYAMSLGNDH